MPVLKYLDPNTGTYKPLQLGAVPPVSTGSGISGDGSAAQPLTVKAPGTWDATLQGIFGATNNNQLPTFIDSAGNIRVPGDLIDAGTVNRLAADMMDKYPSGASVMAISSAQATAGSWPGAGQLLTMKRNSTQGVQYWHSLPALTTPPTIQYRFCDGTGWSAWVTLYQDTGWINLTPAMGTWTTLRYRCRNGVCEAEGNSNVVTMAANASNVVVANGGIPAPYAPVTVGVYGPWSVGGTPASSQFGSVGTNGDITLWNTAASTYGIARFRYVWLKEVS